MRNPPLSHFSLFPKHQAPHESRSFHLSDCSDMSELCHWPTCRPVAKRRQILPVSPSRPWRIASLQSESLNPAKALNRQPPQPTNPDGSTTIEAKPRFIGLPWASADPSPPLLVQERVTMSHQEHLISDQPQSLEALGFSRPVRLMKFHRLLHPRRLKSALRLRPRRPE